MMESNKLSKNYYVYKILDKITNEFYIGSRGCIGNPMDDCYMGSMVKWKPNKNNLTKEIIKSDFLDRSSAIFYEQTLINECINNPLNKNYHIPNQGFHTDGRKHTNDEIKKAVNTRIKNGTYVCSDKTKEKISINHKQKGYKPPQTQKPLSEKTKQKISESNYGKVRSDEFKKYTSERQMGTNNHFYGKSHSEETKQKMREAKKLKSKNYGS
jgi:hypothetical protein